jgi:hypothetical protein
MRMKSGIAIFAFLIVGAASDVGASSGRVAEQPATPRRNAGKLHPR